MTGASGIAMVRARPSDGIIGRAVATGNDRPAQQKRGFPARRAAAETDGGRIGIVAAEGRGAKVAAKIVGTLPETLARRRHCRKCRWRLSLTTKAWIPWPVR